jgi:hypothetical protein
MRTKRNAILFGAFLALAAGSAVAASAAARSAPPPVASASPLKDVPLPALDRLVSKLATEARARRN